ncbi:hypothetical protein ETAA8_62530 [Anatilimnocola aggregata]|uniref:Phorbol-ester/DAG-type domain-containing protein n=1 Tax=Anatilimnocola aggregata TaxID=2528021 RepID=A0A517YLL9_9BACT|nr:hypothetical protein ETAA8_62530 [Anatilimnocola aggregata]
MECIGVLLLVGLVVVLAAFGVFSQTAARFERWNSALAAVAQRFGGTLTRGGWFSNPMLRIPYGTTYARLSVYAMPGSSGRKCLEMIVQWSDIDVFVALVPRLTRRQIAVDLRNFSEVEFDWDDFRARWTVWAEAADEARLLLSTGVRVQLERVSKSPDASETVVLVYPGWLVVRKVWESSRTHDLERYVEMSLGLYDQLLLTKSEGIEFVASDEPQIIDQANCHICGERMLGEIVVCRRCQTPHHRDCWEYAGGCATYGCRETIYLVPRRGISQPAPASDELPPGRPSKPR